MQLYRTDIRSDGNIMPYHIFEMMFPRATNEQVVATKTGSSF